ncbi:type II toxin-antitoxin system RatA family toxin [Flavihumibacter petaseus]|uniref:SRPBCC family protein n=1 Tax=Flavihumibacter petaseus NBRC 106054 TaxID=1220578 RepID=A0A0E9MXT8_9BACT|nr:SRPBCC family protein [Flavihumibacter petaseus]GAO42532.1 hypothetical protein FPE01S_01_15470 [Flavihumibacter petaseus NBRC 106054]
MKFTERIIINCSAVTAFDYTQDYSRRLSWDTFLKRADLMDGVTTAGIGVKAYCVAKNGLGMVTKYVTFNRPKQTAIKMTSGPWFFRSFLGSWNFKAITPAQTEVVFLYSFALRFPLNLISAPVKRNLQANVQQRLADLKKALEAPSFEALQ